MEVTLYRCILAPTEVIRTARTGMGCRMTQRQPASEFRYWAFISYSHKDKSWGRWLHKALETYRVPKRLQGMPTAAGRVPARLTPIFRDRDELPTASNLGTAIEEALRQSWCLIVICSPDAAQSRWVNEEVLAFQRLGRGNRIHCLIVDSGDDAAAPLAFPPALGEREEAEGNRSGEPIAADARRFGDGRTGAKLKLIAGILGIGYDTLVQREQQRRNRNLLAVTCASLALVVVLAAATVIAITSRRDAVDQRTHAESLVEFMIGDLRKKLEPDGKLATLDAVGKEALAYYASQKSQDLDADGLARRARALHMIGEVYDLRGELDEALKVFEQAADSTAELVAREPDNGQRIFDHAQSVFWVGYIAYQRGNVTVAEPAFLEYKRLTERLVAIDPSNDDWQAELGYANSNLGTLLYEQGRLDEAANIYSSELDTAKRMGQEDQETYDRQVRIAQAYARLANIFYVQGRLRESADFRQSEGKIYEEAIRKNPNNNDAKEALSINQRSLGRILLDLGDLTSATVKFERAEKLAATLFATDPDNANWVDSAVAAQTSLAEALTFANQIHPAIGMSANARKLAEELVARDPTVTAWQLRWLNVLLLQARQRLEFGSSDEALRLATDIVNRVDGLPQGKLRDWERTNVLVQALVLVGEAGARSGEITNAEMAWDRVLEVLDGGVEAQIPKNLAARALALSALGRGKRAITAIESLRKIGYREYTYLEALSQVAGTTSLMDSHSVGASVVSRK